MSDSSSEDSGNECAIDELTQDPEVFQCKTKSKK